MGTKTGTATATARAGRAATTPQVLDVSCAVCGLLVERSHAAQVERSVERPEVWLCQKCLLKLMREQPCSKTPPEQREVSRERGEYDQTGEAPMERRELVAGYRAGACHLEGFVLTLKQLLWRQGAAVDIVAVRNKCGQIARCASDMQQAGVV